MPQWFWCTHTVLGAMVITMVTLAIGFSIMIVYSSALLVGSPYNHQSLYGLRQMPLADCAWQVAARIVA